MNEIERMIHMMQVHWSYVSGDLVRKVEVRRTLCSIIMIISGGEVRKTAPLEFSFKDIHEKGVKNEAKTMP